MKQLIFVTGNEGKAREVAHFLGREIKRVKLPLDEIQSLNLKEIVEHKARQAYGKLKQPVLVDDASFEIAQWKGFPGPFAAWIERTIGYDALPKLLTKQNRGARWVNMIGFFDGKVLKIFEGVEDGVIANKPRGKDGYGFDMIFIAEGHSKTNAERGFIEKQKNSARVYALRKLKRFLNSRLEPVAKSPPTRVAR